MSSGFVSGGTIDQETERDAEWKRAAQDLEDQRRAKEDAAKHANDGKTLYEILQANKEKKQAEFEEKARFQLHNALNDDEADYLDSVLEKKRDEEATVRKETSERLDAFRRQQEEAERKALEEDSVETSTEGGEQWAGSARKRKKGVEINLLKGVKLRRSGSTVEEKKVAEQAKEEQESQPVLAKEPAADPTKETPLQSSAASNVSVPTKPSNVSSLGLGYASSSDED